MQEQTDAQTTPTGSATRPRIIPQRARGETNPTTLIIMAAVVAGLLGLAMGVLMQRPHQWASLKTYPEPRPIEPIDLIDSRGQIFGLEQLQDQWDLLFFGFTHCPDICPATLAQLKTLQDMVEGHGEQAPRVTLISVDPERDTPEKMQAYVRHFSPDFRAATGSHDALGALTRNIGVAYFVEEHEDGAAWYNVDHSARVFLVNPEGRLVGLFSPPLDLEAMALDLVELIENQPAS